MNDKILIVGNAGHGKSVYEQLLRNSIEKQMDGLLSGVLTGEASSTCSGTGWDESLTEKSLMDMIYKMEDLLKQRQSEPFPFPVNTPLWEDINLTECKQIKFPRCNKKKIWKLKRWKKKPANFKHIPDSKIYYTKDFAVCHPSIAAEIKKQSHQLKQDGLQWASR